MLLNKPCRIPPSKTLIKLRNRIKAACDEHLPKELNKQPNTSKNLAGIVTAILGLEPTTAMQSPIAVQDWLFSNPHIAECRNDVWYPRKKI
jgi:hypothetical protein